MPRLATTRLKNITSFQKEGEERADLNKKEKKNGQIDSSCICYRAGNVSAGDATTASSA
jgi:hypothetical protein